ncbi:IucA/IucC family C-terminal-domain containing protein [Cohnella sp.]|uniref:IucA/IucC family C-terminal-domain containing protein n=1 Tax=Cohnella sp. TaxID=1883426 RepID=UPI0035671807
MQALDLSELEERFDIRSEDRNGVIVSIPAEQLVVREHADRLLQAYAPLIRARGVEVAATYFSGWYGSICIAMQYMVSHYDHVLDLSLANVTVQLYPNDRYYHFSFKIGEPHIKRLDGYEREEWRNSVLETLYRDNVRPVIESLARSASINAGQLWGQIVTEMYRQVDSWLIDASDNSLKRRISNDFRFLTHGLDADVFGRKKNPFNMKLRTVENLFKPGCQTYIKAACCLAYRTDDPEDNGHKYCYTCPRLSIQEREEYKALILERQAFLS